MTDLFLKKSKKDLILNFIREKKWVRTSELIKFGSSIFYNRAERTARDLAKDGRLKRMDKEDKNFYFNHTKEDVWVFVR